VTLYLYIPVWRRLVDGRLALYRCFEVLGQGHVVQSQDSVDVGGSNDFLNRRQFIELLSEQAPEVRSCPAVSLDQAIADFDADFSVS
jgi:hypothetical protein